MNIDVNIDNLTAEEQNEFNRLVDKANSKRWKPNKGDRYYYITDCGKYVIATWEDNVYANARYRIRNVIKTIPKAKYEVEMRETEALLRNYAEEHNEFALDWTDADQIKYYIYYGFATQQLCVDVVLRAKENNIYFSSQEIAEAAIKEIGEERVTRFYRGY